MMHRRLRCKRAAVRDTKHGRPDGRQNRRMDVCHEGAEGRDVPVCILHQVQPLQQALHRGRDARGRDAAQARVEPEHLPRSQRARQRVELRAGAARRTQRRPWGAVRRCACAVRMSGGARGGRALAAQRMLAGAPAGNSRAAAAPRPAGARRRSRPRARRRCWAPARLARAHAASGAGGMPAHSLSLGSSVCLPSALLQHIGRGERPTPSGPSRPAQPRVPHAAWAGAGALSASGARRAPRARAQLWLTGMG